MSIDQFLNLSKLAGSKLEAASVEAKDRICQMIFLNFVVDTKKVVDFKTREPFATLLKTPNVLNGREQPSALELYNFIIDTSDHYDNLCDELQGFTQYQSVGEVKVLL